MYKSRNNLENSRQSDLKGQSQRSMKLNVIAGNYKLYKNLPEYLNWDELAREKFREVGREQFIEVFQNHNNNR